MAHSTRKSGVPTQMASLQGRRTHGVAGQQSTDSGHRLSTDELTNVTAFVRVLGRTRSNATAFPMV